MEKTESKDESLTFYKLLQEKNKTDDMDIAGKNMFMRDPGNIEKFDLHFNYLLSFAKDKRNDLKKRRHYIERAEGILGYFEENVVLRERSIKKIKEAYIKLEKIEQDYLTDYDYYSQQIMDTEKKENESSLKAIRELILKLQDSVSEDEMQSIISAIEKHDEEINHDYLSDEQKDTYDLLNKNLSEIIPQKMKSVEMAQNKSYNKMAVNSIKYVFDEFKNHIKEYKGVTGSEDDQNWQRLESLLKEKLFGMDHSRFYSETEVYYNHVYGFIFGNAIVLCGYHH